MEFLFVCFVNFAEILLKYENLISGLNNLKMSLLEPPKFTSHLIILSFHQINFKKNRGESDNKMELSHLFNYYNYYTHLSMHLM